MYERIPDRRTLSKLCTISESRLKELAPYLDKFEQGFYENCSDSQQTLDELIILVPFAISFAKPKFQAANLTARHVYDSLILPLDYHTISALDIKNYEIAILCSDIRAGVMTILENPLETTHKVEPSDVPRRIDKYFQTIRSERPNIHPSNIVIETVTLADGDLQQLQILNHDPTGFTTVDFWMETVKDYFETHQKEGRKNLRIVPLVIRGAAMAVNIYKHIYPVAVEALSAGK